jgi:hypothetical protein
MESEVNPKVTVTNAMRRRDEVREKENDKRIVRKSLW